MSDWLIDGMGAIQTVPPADNWGDYANALLTFCTPPPNTEPISLGIIFDSYKSTTTKQLTQARRGVPGKRIFITSAEQSMPKGKDWDSFLKNSENKTELIQFLVEYYKLPTVRLKLKSPLTVTSEETTWHITSSSVTQLASSNHHEADTRLICEASKSNNPVIIRAADTDILILMCYDIFNLSNLK